jgi:hypothetical protein
MADIDSQIAAAEEAVKRSEKAVEDLSQRQQADDRSHIAKLIIWAFCTSHGRCSRGRDHKSKQLEPDFRIGQVPSRHP